MSKNKETKSMKTQEIVNNNSKKVEKEVKINDVVEVKEIPQETNNVKTVNPKKEKTPEQKYQAKKNLLTKTQILDITKKFASAENLTINHLIQFKIYEFICECYKNNVIEFSGSKTKFIDDDGSFIDTFSNNDSKLKTILYDCYHDIRRFHENYMSICKIDKFIEDKPKADASEEEKLIIKFKYIPYKFNKEDYKRTLIAFIGLKLFNEKQSLYHDKIKSIFNEVNKNYEEKRRTEKLTKQSSTSASVSVTDE